uniref:Early protein E4 n=1 Tax=Human papillomavirus type 53 TaxID=333765 RepID=A0A7G2A4L6_HPV53|nr:early protein E4 [Human papillomavirus type 53]
MRAYIIYMTAIKRIIQTLKTRPPNMGVKAHGKCIWENKVFIVPTLCPVPLDPTYPLLKLLTNTTPIRPPPPPRPWAPTKPHHPCGRENVPEPQSPTVLTPPHSPLPQPESPTQSVSQGTQTTQTTTPENTSLVELCVTTPKSTVVIRLHL